MDARFTEMRFDARKGDIIERELSENTMALRIYHGEKPTDYLEVSQDPDGNIFLSTPRGQLVLGPISGNVLNIGAV